MPLSSNRKHHPLNNTLLDSPTILSDAFSMFSAPPDEHNHINPEDMEDMIPPRSPSRLEFRFGADDDHDSDSSTDSESDADSPERVKRKIKWARARRLFGGMPLQVLAEQKLLEELDSDASIVDLIALPSLRNDAGNDSESSSDASESNSEEDLSQLAFPPPPEDVGQSTVLGLCKPEPSRRSTPVETPKDILPPPTPIKPSSQRLNYPHRGFSRSAFMHQKSFWTARREEWVEWQRNAKSNEIAGAYTGIMDSPLKSPRRPSPPPPPLSRRWSVPPSGLERDTLTYTSNRFVQDIHASIYPRVGDVSALRDPYFANVDRCFFQFPLWTIHKTLYVFDMHQRSALIAYSGSENKLVSSLPPATEESRDQRMDEDSDEDRETTSLYSNADDADKTLVVDEPDRVESPKGSWDGERAWELSWYARWELFIGLIQRDHESRQPSPPEPMVHFAGENGEEEGCEDDEEDYGTVVSNPIFTQSFEDGYRRAIGFFSGGGEGGQVTEIGL
ncbi:hypothetical protein BJ138DRAFT_1154874 [Hygrophoropsis aurantiaca]|uniref:Uncharacterized protein n=1 Tax=Hygrophoropsis aurantiaca TaxID=72124 RepID=A0ACB8A953_9AGAM|nr:hypothetical protein BJ138DRAFT_1154874 [Hygrophoropsis aurantiaca]